MAKSTPKPEPPDDLPDDPDEIESPKAGDPANVTDADLDRAAEWWERNAPVEFRGLIEAKEDQSSSRPGRPHQAS